MVPHQSHNLGLAIAFWGLAVIFVGLRCMARSQSGLSFGLDDYLLWAGLLSNTVALAIFGTMTGYGMGQHTALVPLANQVLVLKLQVSFECVYVTTIMIVKGSILSMYCRLFFTRSFKIVSTIVFTITVMWWIAICCVCIFQCVPVAKAWDPSLPGHCIDLRGSFIGNAVPNIVTDLFVLSMPIHHVWRLHASLSFRAGLIAVLLTGSFAIFCSVYRFATVFSFNPADFFWTLDKPTSWCVVETSAGIVSTCLPTLRPLLRAIVHSVGLTIWSSNRHLGPTSKSNKSLGSSGLPKISDHSRTNGTITKIYRHYDNLQSLFRPDELHTTKNSVHSSNVPLNPPDANELPLWDIRVDRETHRYETPRYPEASHNYSSTKPENYSPSEDHLPSVERVPSDRSPSSHKNQP